MKMWVISLIMSIFSMLILVLGVFQENVYYSILWSFMTVIWFIMFRYWYIEEDLE